MRVVVLGAGFGGLELTTRLSDELGDDVDVVLIDQTDGLRVRVLEARRDVRTGAAAAVHHPYRDLVKPGVRFVQATVQSIDPVGQAGRDRRRHVRRRHPGRRARRRPRPRARRPASSRAGTSSTRRRARSRCATCSPTFDGGRVDRRRDLDAVQVPAGAERDRAADARLPHRARAAATGPRSRWSCRCRCRSRRRRRRRRRCWPPSPSAASSGTPSGWSRALDPDRKVAVLARRRRAALRPVPRRPRAPGARGRRGVGPDRRRLDPGRPADARDVVPRRLRGRRRDQRRHAEGGRVRRGPGRGRRRRHRRPQPRRRRPTRSYDGRGICYLEFGDGQVAKVDVTFLSGQAPTGGFDGPSRAVAADKAEFGASRIRRWFGREWSTAEPSA